MKNFATEFQTKHPKIEVTEEKEISFEIDDDGDEVEVENISYNIKSIPGLDDLTLNLELDSQFAQLDALIASKPTVFVDFLGGKFGSSVEVILTKISRGTFIPPAPSRNIVANLSYQGADVTVVLTRDRPAKSNAGFIASNLVGVRINSNRVVATITGLIFKDSQQLESATQSILRSVLFDIEYTYGQAFETTNLENLKGSQRAETRRPAPLPRAPIQLMYKEYTPELIEYFHVAEKVDYLPFKYICYFHIVEYFMDKSAYSVVSRKVKQLLLSPDFHLKSSEHISQAVNIIKLETERNTTDKIKIGRVIGEFIQRDSIKSHLAAINSLSHFTKDHTIVCAKPLKLSAVNFDSDQSFVESASKRVYAVRCSIVHSNPDFDESKAVPFLPTPKNIDFLRTEIDLIREISRSIICNTIA